MIERPTIEQNSNTWLSLKEYYAERLDELRRKNDHPQSVEATEKLRGQIAEIKHLLSFDKP